MRKATIIQLTRKLKLLPVFFLFSGLFLFKFPQKAWAQCDGRPLCSDLFSGFRATPNPNPFTENFSNPRLTVTANGLVSGHNYRMYVDCGGISATGNDYSDSDVTAIGSGDIFSWTGRFGDAACFNQLVGTRAQRDICLTEEGSLLCHVGTYTILSQEEAGRGPEDCDVNFSPPYPAIDNLPSTTLTIGGLQPGEYYSLVVVGPGTTILGAHWDGNANNNGQFIVDDLTNFRGTPAIQQPGVFEFTLQAGQAGIPGFFNPNVCTFSKTIFATTEDPEVPPGGMAPARILKPKCCDVTSGNEVACREVSDQDKGIKTALGCFPTQPKAVISWVLKYAIIMGGGIAFLIMIWGAFQIITSAGDPEKLKEGQQVLTSALGGLLFIIFSIFLLRLIGFTILRIPGFG